MEEALCDRITRRMMSYCKSSRGETVFQWIWGQVLPFHWRVALCTYGDISQAKNADYYAFCIYCVTSLTKNTFLLWKFIGNYMKGDIFVNVLQVRGRCSSCLIGISALINNGLTTHTNTIYQADLATTYDIMIEKSSLTTAWTAPRDIICISSLLYSFCNYL